MFNQHPSLYSFVGPRSTRALNPRHMRVQLGGQAFAHQGIRGFSGAQIPFEPHHHHHHPHHAYPVNDMPVNPSRSRGPRSLHPGYNVRRRSSVPYILIKPAYQETYGQYSR